MLGLPLALHLHKFVPECLELLTVLCLDLVGFRVSSPDPRQATSHYSSPPFQQSREHVKSVPIHTQSYWYKTRVPTPLCLLIKAADLDPPSPV